MITMFGLLHIVKGSTLATMPAVVFFPQQQITQYVILTILHILWLDISTQ